MVSVLGKERWSVLSDRGVERLGWFTKTRGGWCIDWPVKVMASVS